jgi:hypothetical protein
MSFSWGYVWRQWRATLQVEPLFLDPGGNLTHASRPESGALVEGNRASIEQSSTSRDAPGRSRPTMPRNPPR